MNQTLEERLRALPEIIAERGIWQNKFHEYDVYEHTIQYVHFLKELTPDIEMIVAGYLHDIGKPVVRKIKVKEGRIEEKLPGLPYHDFDDHEKVGEDMVRSMPAEFFSQNALDQERIAKLVGAHYLPMENIKKMRKTKTYEEFPGQYKQLEQALDSTGLPRADVMTMFLADCLSKGKGCTDIEELKLARTVIINTGNPDLLKNLYEMQKTMYGVKE
ncbi:MAG: HD domain-containing protein [Nanoarchaeota archaeon]